MSFSVAGALLGAWLASAQAQDAPAPAAAGGQSREAALLARCDELLERRLIAAARTCYEQLEGEHAGTPEARDARRALATMRALVATPGRPPPGTGVVLPEGTAGTAAPGTGGRLYLLEPFSTQTNERLRISTWEKLDFGITSFLYGMSTGLSMAAAGETDSVEGVVSTVVIGSLVYTGLAVAYVNLAKPDRGDLPLTLAISSYLPLTAVLGAMAAEVEDARAVAGTAAGAALLSIPLAYLAAARTDLDPGDTQLVRDAGFWGGVIAFSAASAASLGAGDNDLGRASGAAGLAGLYGGMGLGLLAARYSEVSLERIRVTTWGGYGGGLLGVLLGMSSENADESVFTGLAAGSAIGLVVTFLSTSSIDKAPDETRVSSVRYLEPTMLPLVGRDGRAGLHPGVSVARGRF